MTNVRIRLFAKILLIFIAANLVSGAAVAGIDAGKVFNTFPTMNGSFIPSNYWNEEIGWRNLFENCATVQFNHRLAAYNTLIYVVCSVIRFRNKKNLTKRVIFEIKIFSFL